MKLSIVVPAFNEEKLLPGTLRAIATAAAALTEAGFGWECIVCDNNSTDRTPDVAREHGARVVFEPVNQIARARNAGASVATGDWLLFVDADSRPSKELFAEVAALIAEDRVLFAGALVAMDTKLRWGARVALEAWNTLSRWACWVAGSFVLVETTLFREVGGFDQRFFAGEEVDLSRRLKRAARRRGKRGAIITRRRLETSARRLKMYTARELAGFFWKAARRPWSTTSNREACGMWYDGRR